jgi:hypothetical protein
LAGVVGTAFPSISSWPSVEITALGTPLTCRVAIPCLTRMPPLAIEVLPKSLMSEPLPQPASSPVANNAKNK